MPKTKLESEFQSKLQEDLRTMLPGCYIEKKDANNQQGMPDLLILWGVRWAILECKRSANEPSRPNQPYFVEKFNGMSFAAFIFPENKEEVLDALAEAFGVTR